MVLVSAGYIMDHFSATPDVGHISLHNLELLLLVHISLLMF